MSSGTTARSGLVAPARWDASATWRSFTRTAATAAPMAILQCGKCSARRSISGDVGHSASLPRSARWATCRAQRRPALPLRELRRMERILELDDPVPNVCLCVHHGGVVDGGPDLLEQEVEEELSGQLAELVLELLGEVAADRRERLGARI